MTMKTPADYVRLAKIALGDEDMSDRELGQHLGGLTSGSISNARYGRISDPLAMRLASVAGIPPGELLMVARLEREKDPAVRAALMDWAKNVLALMPEKAAPVELVRGGVRVGRSMRQNRLIMPTHQAPASARPMVRSLHFSRAAMARSGRPWA